MSIEQPNKVAGEAIASRDELVKLAAEKMKEIAAVTAVQEEFTDDEITRAASFAIDLAIRKGTTITPEYIASPAFEGAMIDALDWKDKARDKKVVSGPDYSVISRVDSHAAASKIIEDERQQGA